MKILRKLIISVVSLVAVVICFVATTYAWFDVNSEANVEGFNFTAISGEGFQVSVDGINYSSDLTAKQMKQAILKGYDKSFYEFDSLGNLIETNSKNVVDEETISERISNNIQLFPVTSYYGYDIRDSLGVELKAGSKSGRYVEFDLYFKTTSHDPNDKYEYNISLLVASGPVTPQYSSIAINPTNILSTVDNVELRANMNTIFGNMIEGQNIDVYSMNALRFSTETLQFITEEETLDNGTTQEVVKVDTSHDVRLNNSYIYEFYNNYDLGSYAIENGQGIYNPNTNAMFTYYNNQKITDIEPLAEDKKPNSIRYQVGTDLASGEKMPVIATVKTGSEAQVVTFRFWLEGWDADCFDGIAKSIKVNLTFNSEKV